VWANPWEDWRIQDGKLECIKTDDKNRTVHCLTHQLNGNKGTAEIAVTIEYQGDPEENKSRTGSEEGVRKPNATSSAGFEIGIQVDDPLDDYRSRLLWGRGIELIAATDGILRAATKNATESKALATALAGGKPIRLVCTIYPEKEGVKYGVKLEARDPNRKNTLLAATKVEGIAGEKLVGNVALVNRKGLFRFSDWTIKGTKITGSAEQSFGPILWTLYTLSKKVMKMTAQMPPIGEADEKEVYLQTRASGQWNTIATAKIDPLSWTATFRVADWDDTMDIPYRVSWNQRYPDGNREQFTWSGLVRKDPKEKPEIVVAGYCCFKDYLFPNLQLAAQTRQADPDIMFFVGDQIYEDVGGYGIIREGERDIKSMMANYLRKLALLGWSFRELSRERPTVLMPDDHDVYQGNLWGAGGRKVTVAEWESPSEYQGKQCYGHKGGYVQPADWVKAVERTQTAHLPDPFDPTPIKQGIGVYYTALNYGRVSFAIVEDRKFKTGPIGAVKHTGPRADWLADFSAGRAADVPGAELFGQRQLLFLRHWVTDWQGADMKMVISQTIPCGAATHHGEGDHFVAADLDSNGWPQSGRNEALDIWRRCYALILAGDQHLPTIVQHGIKKHHDAGYSFCVPAGATGYQRWWRPEEIAEMVREGDRHAGRENTGKYQDGLGNLIDVWAVANPPVERDAKTRLEIGRQKSAGFGMVRVNKTKGTFTLEAWPVGVEMDKGDMYPGWPLTVSTADSGGASNPILPAVVLEGWTEKILPVVQVCGEDGQTISIARMSAKKFSPRVFEPEGEYTVNVIVPEAKEGQSRVVKTFDNVRVGQARELVVR